MRNYDLKVHARTHTGEKQFRCDAPGVVLPLRRVAISPLTNALIQARSHTDVTRPGVELSSQRVALLLSTNAPTPARNLSKCDSPECGAAFAASTNLLKHKRAIHTERGQQRQKKREEAVARFLESVGVRFEREQTVRFCGEGNKKSAA